MAKSPFSESALECVFYRELLDFYRSVFKGHEVYFYKPSLSEEKLLGFDMSFVITSKEQYLDSLRSNLRKRNSSIRNTQNIYYAAFFQFKVVTQLIRPRRLHKVLPSGSRYERIKTYTQNNTPQNQHDTLIGLSRRMAGMSNVYYACPQVFNMNQLMNATLHNLAVAQVDQNTPSSPTDLIYDGNQLGGYWCEVTSRSNLKTPVKLERLTNVTASTNLKYTHKPTPPSNQTPPGTTPSITYQLPPGENSSPKLTSFNNTAVNYIKRVIKDETEKQAEITLRYGDTNFTVSDKRDDILHSVDGIEYLEDTPLETPLGILDILNLINHIHNGERSENINPLDMMLIIEVQPRND